MKETVMIVFLYMIVLVGLSSCETNFLEYCPNNIPCDEPIMEDSCDTGEHCTNLGCTRECKTPTNIECNSFSGCTCNYENYSYENLCSEDQVCCYEDCTHTCKEKLYTDADKSTYNVTGQGCCDLGTLGGLLDGVEIDCSERKTCVINGCQTKCSEIVFSNASCTDPTNPDCKCEIVDTYVKNCPANEFCCEENCLFVCKENIPIIVESTTDITDKGCCYGFHYDYEYFEEVDCSEGETCIINGCQTECRTPTFRDDPFFGEGCYYDYTYEYNCPDEQQCCGKPNCGFTCEDKRYAKGVCPEPSSKSLVCDLKSKCNIFKCQYGQICCPGSGICPFLKTCTTPVYKRAVCPDNYEIYNKKTEPKKCFSNSTCTDNDQLCCRLYSDRNDTYCREPKYVDDDNIIIAIPL